MGFDSIKCKGGKMKSKKNLIIFIDSLPFGYACKMSSISKFKPVKVTPGFGYSVNILPELLGGYSPDDINYFNEWGYNGRSHFKIFKILNVFRFNYYIDRIIHRLVSKFIANVANIPFHILPYFKHKQYLPYIKGFPKQTILSEKNFNLITYNDFKGENLDKKVFIKTKKDIPYFKNTFITFCDLDHIGHIYGVGSREYKNKINELDYYIEELNKITTQENYNLIVLSDHGMVNVKGSVNIKIEKAIGKASKKNYLYFIDSTLLRVWVFNENYKEKVLNYIKKIKEGHILTEKERLKYGLVSRKFGDIIFILDEGFVFSPSFFGKKIPKAMHGYSPELESQKAFIACNKEEIKDVNNAKDVYEFFEGQIE